MFLLAFPSLLTFDGCGNVAQRGCDFPQVEQLVRAALGLVYPLHPASRVPSMRPPSEVCRQLGCFRASDGLLLSYHLRTQFRTLLVFGQGSSGKWQVS